MESQIETEESTEPWKCVSIYGTTGRLEVRALFGGTYEARFVGVTVRELIQAIAVGLSREQRYSNQLIRPFTVLQHVWSLMDFFFQEQDEEGVYRAAIHDGSENFVRDVSSPLKTPQAEAMELAIQSAMPWRRKGHSSVFHQVDVWAAKMEGELLGGWDTEIARAGRPTDPWIRERLTASIYAAERLPVRMLQEMWRAYMMSYAVRDDVMESFELDTSFDLSRLKKI